MWVIIFNISWTLFNNNIYFGLQSHFNKNINEKAENVFRYIRELNANGSGFIDNISCPTTVTMSGTTIRQDIGTTIIYSSWSVFCQWTYQSNTVSIYFNTGFTDFSGATYISTVWLTNGVGNSTFSDADNTLMSFSTSWLAWIDGIDDNLNNDDYKPSGTGSVYPVWYEDDDIDGRKTIFWYILASDEKNIFWINKTARDVITTNTNNSWSAVASTATWNLHLQIDSDFFMKIVQFDKNEFENTKSLKVIQQLTTTQSWWISWYIQTTGAVSTGWLTPTWNEYVFDFANNDYAIFLMNYSTWTLFFQMKGYTSSGSSITIVPIDDSMSSFMTYMWGDIIYSDDGYYMYSEKQVTWVK